MKNLILLLTLFAITTGVSYSQTVYTATPVAVTTATYNGSGKDTAIYKATGNYSRVAIQVDAIKVSGTVAGTAIVKGSLTGVNYVTFGADTMVLTNQTTNTKIWNLGPNNYLFYLVEFSGSGTMVVSPKVNVIVRQ